MAVMEELLSTVDAVFEEKQEIKATAAELDLAELKVRKLLSTKCQTPLQFLQWT